MGRERGRKGRGVWGECRSVPRLGHVDMTRERSKQDWAGKVEMGSIEEVETKFAEEVHAGLRCIVRKNKCASIIKMGRGDHDEG